MKLQVIIEQDETGYYVAEVPALPGCFSQGKTLAETKANIKEAIIGWLQVMNRKAKRRKELGIGLLKKLIKQAGLTVDEFNSL